MNTPGSFVTINAKHEWQKTNLSRPSRGQEGAASSSTRHGQTMTVDQVRQMITEQMRNATIVQDPSHEQLMTYQSERQVGESTRLKMAEGLFSPNKYSPMRNDGPITNRLEVLAGDFTIMLSQRHFPIHARWNMASAKHFVCADWSIGGAGVAIGLHMFSPNGVIESIGDFIVATSIWADCEA